jgi:hypothetical protein
MPDAYESNDTLATAKHLGRTNGKTLSGLTIHDAADIDFFTWTARASGSVSVSIAAPGTDVHFAVYDANQHLLGDRAAGEPITLTLTKGQRYTIKVLSASGMTTAYDLGIAKAVAPSGGTNEAFLATMPHKKHQRHDFDDNA